MPELEEVEKSITVAEKILIFTKDKILSELQNTENHESKL